MSATKLEVAEQQLRSALKVLDNNGAVGAKHFERLIILAADLQDSAKRIRRRAMKFKKPDGASNDNEPRSY